MVFQYLMRTGKYHRDHDKEYMVKAAMLVKFRQLTKWPESTSSKDETTTSICVVGENPFTPKAREVFTAACTPAQKYEILKGQAYKKQFCHIVYVGRCDKDKVEKILDDLKGVPSLTVSDIPGFADMGGNIEFETAIMSEKNQTIKLIVNERSALEKGLVLDKEMKQRGVTRVIRKSN